MTIKNIIFDLGGVVINIEYKKTAEAFKKLGVNNFDEVYTQSKQDTLFDDYDIGKISSDTFRRILKERLDLPTNDEKFDAAWNAMLLDLPIERLDLIKKLRQKYKTFLFSNTNEIHLKEVFNICFKQHGFSSFDGYFEKEYYSNIFGMRKPNPESFLAILKENKLNPNETLFIDDSLQHVLGARKAGIHAIHLTGDATILDIEKMIKKINAEINDSKLKEASRCVIL